jgi:hypothetical protein
MDTRRRKCRIANSEYQHIDLRVYEQIIVDTINQTVPGKNPKVFQHYFSTDVLTQSEAVLIGRALSKIEGLSNYGKRVEIFRLFDGSIYESEEDLVPIQKHKTKGGRIKSKS